MSIYKEGFHIVEEIKKASKQVFNDACDYGAPVKKGDRIWNMMKQLVDWYGDYDNGQDIVKFPVNRSESGCETKFQLMDEWNTGKEITMTISYNKLKPHPSLNPAFQDVDGFVSIY